MACAVLIPQELESYGLRRCFYASVYCKRHDELRVALPEPPNSIHPCPACQLPSRCVPLGEGGTRLQRPFWRYRTRNPAIACELWRLLKAQSKAV